MIGSSNDTAPDNALPVMSRLQLRGLGRDALTAATAEMQAIKSANAWAADVRAALVTFLVALPLSIGIALASGMPAMTGVLTGVIGGLLVGALSQTSFMVTGPAAGLAALTVTATATLGSYRGVLAALVMAGVLQIVLGLVGAGVLSFMVPLSVIKGMLMAIGVILVLKQIPHALGYNADFQGDEAFRQLNDENTFSTLATAMERVHPGAATLTAVSLILLIVWSKTPARRWLPGPLLIVVLSVLLNAVMGATRPAWHLTGEQLVTLPPVGSWGELGAVFLTPDWQVLARPEAWRIALTLGLVASLESLLCLSAMNRIDPIHREPSTNRELLAQGVGNAVSGLVGGLPMSGVVVRSAVNAEAGAQTKAAVILHALLFVVTVLLLPGLLNQIPIAALAGILIYTGYRLAHPSLLQHAWRQGWRQFLPFLVTVVAILVTELLTGIAAGLVVGFVCVLLEHQRSTGFSVVSPPGAVLTRLRLNDRVSFLHKASLAQRLEKMPAGSRIELDGRNGQHIDHDVLELIHEFTATARSRSIDYRLVGIPDSTTMPARDP